MLSSNHPNVAQAHEVFFKKDKIHMVMDFYIDLADIIHEEKLLSNELTRR